MIMLFRKVAIAALSVAAVGTTFMPAQAAMPVVAAPAAKIEMKSDVTEVRHRGGPRGYYHGHRGYRHHRPGYRYHDGYWFPLAAFGAGALIGGALAAPPRYADPLPPPPPPPPAYGASGINPRHYEWCQARYRSYDPYSNTFQPYNGPRRQCYSPYY